MKTQILKNHKTIKLIKFICPNNGISYGVKTFSKLDKSLTLEKAKDLFSILKKLQR